MQGTVSEFECREVAVFVNVTWRQWTDDMDGMERAFAVAHYRTSISIKAHVEDAASNASRRARGRQSRRRRGSFSPSE